jgi:hypothetical protein
MLCNSAAFIRGDPVVSRGAGSILGRPGEFGFKAITEGPQLKPRSQTGMMDEEWEAAMTALRDLQATAIRLCGEAAQDARADGLRAAIDARNETKPVGQHDDQKFCAAAGSTIPARPVRRPGQRAR